MKICLVCSHGGHLTETLQLLAALEGHDLIIATYRGPRDREISAITTTYFTDNIGTSPVRLLMAVPWSYRILRREKPATVLSMGAEIAIPFFYCARLLGIRTVFIESWCRVQTLSRTAKLIYPMADVFWVQWPELLSKCGPKAQFIGAII